MQVVLVKLSERLVPSSILPVPKKKSEFFKETYQFLTLSDLSLLNRYVEKKLKG
jgi:hypothetical protein